MQDRESVTRTEWRFFRVSPAWLAQPSSPPADGDEGREADQQRSALVGALHVLPPPTRRLGEERPVRLEPRDVTAEEELEQRAVDEDLHGIDGKHVQALLLQQSRDLSTDPAVRDRIGVRQDDGARGGLGRVVDDERVFMLTSCRARARCRSRAPGSRYVHGCAPRLRVSPQAPRCTVITFS